MNIFYVRFDKTALIAKTEVDDLSNITHLPVNEIYQLILVEGKEYMIKQFYKDDKETYKIAECNGKFFLNINTATEITGLNELPKYKIISVKEYKDMIAEIEKKRMASENINKKY